MLPRYFSGKATDMGHVAALKQQTFAELVETLLRVPVKVGFTQASLLALPDKEQNEKKRVQYLTACTFKHNPSIRVKGQALHCNLICLDVDRTDDAKRLLESHWDVMLQGLSYVVHHTSRSTERVPRLRIIVSAEGIPVEAYPLAVEKVAQRVGVAVTRESLVCVQPMYLPTQFEHDTRELIVTVNTTGREFTTKDLEESVDQVPDDLKPDEPPPVSDVADLTHLRLPIEGVTVEDAQGALDHLDPDCTMMQWIEVGAGLKHQFQEEGYNLWLEWSRKGKKFTNDADTRYRWDTLTGQTKDRVPKTIRSIFRLARMRGWQNDRLAKKAFAETIEWLKDPARSTEELFDSGTARIARVVPMMGEMERDSLIVALKDRLTVRGMKLGLPAIRREVEKLEIESEKLSAGVPPWVAGLVYVTNGGFFYRYNVDRRFQPEVIDMIYSAPTFGTAQPPRTSVYLVKHAGIPQVENLRYEPARHEERIFNVGGVPYINIYRPTFAKPDAGRRREAGEIVEMHMRNLIAEPEYQELFLDYLTYHVQKPGRKVRWAPMLQTTKGGGKGWVAEMLNVVLGASNVAKLGPSVVMDSPYNDWAVGVQVVIMEEVRVVGHNRYEVMDKLKPLITDNTISMNVKFENHRTVPNVTNYLLFTNHHDALAVQDDERRYFVISSPLQRPEQLEALGGEAYFNKLYAQVENNPGGLRAYFESRKISSNFKPEGRAPITKYLRELAMAGASPLAAAVLTLIDEAEHPLIKKDLVSITTLRSVIEHSENVGRFTDQALSAVLRDFGFTKLGRFRVKDERHQLWARNFTGNARLAAEERLEIL